MKKHIILSIVLLFTSTFYAQNIEWNNIERNQTLLAQYDNCKIIHIKQKSFFKIVIKSKQMMMNSNTTIITRFDDFKEVSTNTIDFNIGGNPTYLDAIQNKDNLLVFFHTKEGEKRKLYYQSYNSNCKVNNKPTLISEYKVPIGWNVDNSFKIIESSNKEYFCVNYSAPIKKENLDDRSEVYGYKVLNSDLNILSEGIFDSPFSKNHSEFTSAFLTNSGKFCFAIKQLEDPTINKEKNKLKTIKYFAYISEDNNFKKIEIKLEDKNVLNLNFLNEVDNSISCLGFYSGKNNSTCGSFLAKIDKDKSSVTDINLNEYSFEFITHNMSSKDLKKAKKNFENGSPELELVNFKPIDIYTLKDNSMIIVMEDNNITSSSTTTIGRPTDVPKGEATTFAGGTSYYFNDLIIIKIKENGGFEWKSRIKKEQIDQNINSFFCSIFGFIQDDDKLSILFNDNDKNYNQDGNFNKDVDINYIMPYAKSCLSRLDINTSTGEYKRYKFTFDNEKQTMMYPKFFNFENDELFLYGLWKIERFGLLKL